MKIQLLVTIEMNPQQVQDWAADNLPIHVEPTPANFMVAGKVAEDVSDFLGSYLHAYFVGMPGSGRHADGVTVGIAEAHK